MNLNIIFKIYTTLEMTQIENYYSKLCHIIILILYTGIPYRSVSRLHGQFTKLALWCLKCGFQTKNKTTSSISKLQVTTVLLLITFTVTLVIGVPK